MNIKDLQPKQASVNVEGTIVEISPPREFQKFGRPGKVANSMMEDETGKIVLTLWNEDVDRFKVGDKIVVTNGFVNEWQGEKQLTSGRYGSIEKPGEEGTVEEKVEEPAPKKETKK